MKVKALKIVNPIMALLIILIIASLVMVNVFDIEFAKEMHEICGALFVILALVHIYLNWAWIKTHIFKIKPHK